MADYQVKSHSTRTFTLREADAVLGELTYTEWFSFKALLNLSDSPPLQIEPKGFWGTTIELKEQGEVLLSFKMHWNGNILLKSRMGGVNQTFVLKSRSLLKNEYVLLNKADQQLLLIRPDFRWNSANYDYTISSNEDFEALAAKHVLLLIAVHCTNYYLTMMTSTVLLSA
ncbi:hypothetical protein [Hymenobacter canadensis]|uniref:Uncharacterized protein n=1 Tax=Hymenobacter canadensis TaxID=2999067 RepID=A0ABY7LTF6_9BACT|nr:hypothetical protein [Hymenobacter canadensis]WBA43686.1 hypothetical protein O3303_08975 [Hymenobacter canadensis]